MKKSELEKRISVLEKRSCSDGFVHWISIKDGLPPKPLWEGYMLLVVVLVDDALPFLAEWNGKSFYPTRPGTPKCVYEDVTHWAILGDGNPTLRKNA